MNSSDNASELLASVSASLVGRYTIVQDMLADAKTSKRAKLAACAMFCLRLFNPIDDLHVVVRHGLKLRYRIVCVVHVDVALCVDLSW